MSKPTLWGFFRRPFPKAEGFSPYRSPGALVHLPVLGLCLFWGFMTLEGSWLCLLALHGLLGLYLGRQAAIRAHYNLLITLLTLGMGLGVLLGLAQLMRFRQALLAFNLPAPLLATASLAPLVGWLVWELKIHLD